LSLKADSITKTNKRVRFFLQTAIYPFGNASATLSMNPLDSGDLDLKYFIDQVPVTTFNPYIITYTSYPLNKGTLTLSGSWKVREGNIKSNNRLLLVDPHVGSRLKSTNKWMPLPFIMAFVRERGNIIDYKIPISGNLKNPKFHLRDVLLDLFENVFVKPPTIPYGLEVKSTERSIESSIVINWRIGQSKLDDSQKRFINKMALFLKRNKNASIDIYPEHFASKEKEHILFFETQKKYFLLTNVTQKSLSVKDSIRLEKLSVKKISRHLVKGLTPITRDTTMFTIHDKCNYFLGDNRVDIQYQRLLNDRENALRSILVRKGVDKQVVIHSNKSVIPFDGFSSYKIQYNGELPSALKESYVKLYNLNNHRPRNKYFKPTP
jgi:hypothetical protein